MDQTSCLEKMAKKKQKSKEIQEETCQRELIRPPFPLSSYIDELKHGCWINPVNKNEKRFSFLGFQLSASSTKDPS